MSDDQPGTQPHMTNPTEEPIEDATISGGGPQGTVSAEQIELAEENKGEEPDAD